jgi:hypothetical protein
MVFYLLLLGIGVTFYEMYYYLKHGEWSEVPVWAPVMYDEVDLPYIPEPVRGEK